MTKGEGDGAGEGDWEQGSRGTALGCGREPGRNNVIMKQQKGNKEKENIYQV